MIMLKIKNAPSGANSWMAAFYPVSGGIVSPNATLGLSASWSFSPGVGAGVTTVDLRFIVYSNSAGTTSGFNALASKDLYSALVTDGNTYTFNWNTGVLESGSTPAVPDPEFRNLVVYSVSSPVKAGNWCIVSCSFEYQGPAMYKELYAAIGNKSVFGFDEILYDTSERSLPETLSWTKYWGSVMILITADLDPNGSPYDVYAKLDGAFPEIISPIKYDIVSMEEALPNSAWQNIRVTSYDSQVDIGGNCKVRVTFQYQGPAVAEKLHVAIGASGWAGFDEILTAEQLYIMPESETWQTVIADISIPITAAINPANSPYSLYAKIGGVISPTLSNVIIVNGGLPATSEFRNLIVTSWTTPVKSGQNCRISVSWEYRGPALSKSLYAAIGAAGWAGFDEILAGSKTIQIPKSDDWASYTAYVDILITTSLDPSNSPYSCYAKFDGEIISPTQHNVIQVEGDTPQFRNLVVKSVTSPVSVGNTCWIETSFEYKGPATSNQLYAAIGIKGVFGFDEVLNATQEFTLTTCSNWTAQTSKVPIFISESIDPSKSPYDVYAKVVDPELISSVKMGAINIVAIPGEGEITGQIVDVQPTTIKSGNPLELSVQIQAFNDNAWQQINGWWTRITGTLGTLTGNTEIIHLGRDATDTIKVLLGVMNNTTLTGKVVLEGCPGDAVENPISPTPPTTGWYKVAEKVITITPSGTSPTPTPTASSWGLVAIAGIAVLAIASGSSKSKSKVD